MKPPEDARMTRWCAILMLAWIAWQHSVFQSKGLDEWTPAGATETSEECKQAAVTASGNAVHKVREQNEKGTTITQTGAVIEMVFASGEKASIAFVCLPDTVDPRAPKGK